MKIQIKGRDFAVELPPVDVREDLVLTYNAKAKRGGVPLARASAAMVAACVPEVAFGVRSGVSASVRGDLAEYGGEVYAALREKGWAVEDIIGAASQLFPELLEATFPREKEVQAAMGKSEAGTGT
jgi:hypothetical protein